MKKMFYNWALKFITKFHKNDPVQYYEGLEERLTYVDETNGQTKLFYGYHEEWSHFGRYDILMNAIRKLADYEDAEIKAKEEAAKKKAEEQKKAAEKKSTEVKKTSKASKKAATEQVKTLKETAAKKKTTAKKA